MILQKNGVKNSLDWKKLKITGYNLFTALNSNTFTTLKFGSKWKKLSQKNLLSY